MAVANHFKMEIPMLSSFNYLIHHSFPGFSYSPVYRGHQCPNISVCNQFCLISDAVESTQANNAFSAIPQWFGLGG